MLFNGSVVTFLYFESYHKLIQPPVHQASSNVQMDNASQQACDVMVYLVVAQMEVMNSTALVSFIHP